MEIVAFLLAACLIGWWCEITAKVKEGSIREFYLGENHPMNHRVVRIDHKGFLYWRVHIQRCVLGYTENDGQLVKVKGSDELGTVTNYNVVNGFTVDDAWAYIPIWKISAIMQPQLVHADTEKMKYVGDVDGHLLNSWYAEE